VAPDVWDYSVPERNRMDHLPTVVGLGEILWDLLPSGRQLGGAPANFAYCSHLLGNRAVVASRVGSDDLGRGVRESLLRSGLTDQFLQIDPSHATGTVHVELDSSGQPNFEIADSVAWDFLDWSEVWQALAQSADAVCFGSLAQRLEISRRTILDFLDGTRPEALRVFDVNLRQSFFSAEVIRDSVKRANVVKLNHEELPRIAELLAIESDDGVAFCRELLQKFELQLVCVTRGANGSLLCDCNSSDEHPGFRVQIRDTVGAGDAFTAALVHGLLRQSPLVEMNDLANRMGAWVASCSGAMPPPPEVGLTETLSRIR
jgi:fructokinase